MADIPSVPTPQQQPAPATTSTPAPVETTAQLMIRDIPVQRAPADMPQQIMKGTVVSSDPKTHETIIRTAAGDVTIRPSVQLPEGLEVNLQLYLDKNQLRANITLLKNIRFETQELQKIVQTATTAPRQVTTSPAPPLQEGKQVTALLMPSRPMLPIPQIAAALQQIKTLPQTQPLPAQPPQPLMQSAMKAPDIESFLVKLPQQQLQQISDFVSTNMPLLLKQAVTTPAPAPAQNILKQVLSAYMPQTVNTPAAPLPQNAPEIIDDNMLEIMRAQIHAKMAQQSIQPQPESENAPPRVPIDQRPLPDMVRAISSLLEDAEAATKKTFHTASFFERILPLALRAPAPMPQNFYKLDIIRILSPGTPPDQVKAAIEKAAAASPQQPVMQAEVESVTASGQPILKTTDSHFVLKEPVNTMTGSIIIFKSVQMTPEQVLAEVTARSPTMRSLVMQPEFDPLTSMIWHALQETHDTVQASPNQQAAQALRDTLPTPSARLAPTALFFLAALRMGVVEKWLGDGALELLRQSGKKDLAQRLGGDFAKLASQSKDIITDGWRAISIPLMHDDQLSQMQFYVRQQYDREGREQQGDGKPSTRFILNLRLSRMGDMQLDGFIQKKNFDMILRTQDKLPFDMRQELMKRFAQGLEQVNMQGIISFQTRRQGWMTVEPPSTPNRALFSDA